MAFLLIESEADDLHSLLAELHQFAYDILACVDSPTMSQDLVLLVYRQLDNYSSFDNLSRNLVEKLQIAADNSSRN